MASKLNVFHQAATEVSATENATTASEAIAEGPEDLDPATATGSTAADLAAPETPDPAAAAEGLTLAPTASTRAAPSERPPRLRQIRSSNR